MASPLSLPEDAEPIPVAPPSLARRLLLGGVAVLAAAAFLVTQLGVLRPGSDDGGASAGDRVAAGKVRILSGDPSSLDPAAHGDATSAAVIAQLHETLTAFDPALTLRPALAEGWQVTDGGRRIVFTLREGLRFSDGSPLRASDVVHSWRRLVDPGSPSPLASLLGDVVGASALLDGSATDVATLGVRADGERRVVVDLVRPATDFPAIVSAPPFAIVSEAATDAALEPDATSFVGSGGYILADTTADGYRLVANPHYWAGSPAIEVVELVTDLGGGSAVEAFEDGDLDVAPIADIDARWIAYDETLGPQLRSSPALSVAYFGWDTAEPPFDDLRVRQAFAMAVDWRRLAALDEPGSSAPATGLVPEGIPGRPDGDFLPPHDPDRARALLAEAGFPDGTGFPEVGFLSAGGDDDDAIVADLERELGVTIRYETIDFGSYIERLDGDPPAMWGLGWVADYPSPNDFLGVLLGSTSTSNHARWRNADFDAAIARATSAGDAAAATAAYAEAMAIVRDEAPVVPVSYGVDWSLTREGLLGATNNGLGQLRFAGLAWEDAP